MSRCRIPVGLTLFFIWCSPVRSAIEIGFVGQSGWSDNTYLGNPDGWGMFLSKNLSPKLQLRFSFIRLENSYRHVGIMQFGFPPPDADTTHEFIYSEVSVSFYELSVHHALLEGSKMRLEAGGGIGHAAFDLQLRGESTGKEMQSTQSPTVLTTSIDVTVKRFIRAPLSLRLGWQYRRMWTASQATDSFEPFNEVSLTTVYVAVLMRK